MGAIRVPEDLRKHWEGGKIMEGKRSEGDAWRVTVRTGSEGMPSGLVAGDKQEQVCGADWGPLQATSAPSVVAETVASDDTSSRVTGASTVAHGGAETSSFPGRNCRCWRSGIAGNMPRRAEPGKNRTKPSRPGRRRGQTRRVET